MAKADLHTHTLFSDGKLSPTELVHKAKSKSISLLSITDHDSIEGLNEASTEANKIGIQFINGVEITTDFNGQEAHLLAYSFNSNAAELIEFFYQQKEFRQSRIQVMIEKLNEMGVAIEMNDVLSLSEKGTVGRPHIAKALIQKGFVKHSREAFYKYIGNKSPAYVKTEHPDYKEVIKLIHRAKGKAILAHPAKSYSEKELNEWIYHGIDGFEMIHPRHPYQLQQKFENLSNQFGLLKTGGSDFHGYASKDEVYFGVVTINTLIVEKLVTLQQQNNNQI